MRSENELLLSIHSDQDRKMNRRKKRGISFTFFRSLYLEREERHGWIYVSCHLCRLRWSLGSWDCTGSFASLGLAMSPAWMFPLLVFLISMTDTRVGQGCM